MCGHLICNLCPRSCLPVASAACPSPCIGHRVLGSLEKARADRVMPGMMPKAVE